MVLEPCGALKAKIIKFTLLNIIHQAERLQHHAWNGGWLFSKHPLLLSWGADPKLKIALCFCEVRVYLREVFQRCC